MKKVLTGIMALGMLGSVTTALPSIALNETTGSTSVTYTAAQSYSASIPSNVTLSADASTAEFTLTTTDGAAVRIPYGNNLTYKIDPDCIDANGNLTLTQNGSNETSKVVLKKGDQTITKSSNTVFESGAKLASEGKISEEITVDASTVSTVPRYSGDYTGTITFDISVE